MKVATAKDLCELLRKYNAVSVGDVGIVEAYAKFLKDAGIKRTQPTKEQKEVLNYLKRLRGVRPMADKTEEVKRLYSLNCDQCGEVFKGSSGFPYPPLCPKCRKPKPDENRYKHLETELGNEHPPLIDRAEMLCSSLNGKYCFDAVKDVIIEACLHQRDLDIAWYEAARQQNTPKPNESRLWTPSEVADAITKTASIKDAECQRRVERIKRKIESTYKERLKNLEMNVYYITDGKWNAIWKKGGL